MERGMGNGMIFGTILGKASHSVLRAPKEEMFGGVKLSAV